MLELQKLNSSQQFFQELIKQHEFIKKPLEDLKNQGQEIMLENDEFSLKQKKVRNKYRDAVTRYNILIDEIESKSGSFKKTEKQKSTEQEETKIRL